VRMILGFGARRGSYERLGREERSEREGKNLIASERDSEHAEQRGKDPAAVNLNLGSKTLSRSPARLTADETAGTCWIS
jgi:hypothetical protein